MEPGCVGAVRAHVESGNRGGGSFASVAGLEGAAASTGGGRVVDPATRGLACARGATGRVACRAAVVADGRGVHRGPLVALRVGVHRPYRAARSTDVLEQGGRT